ncbi:MAG: chemotaxis protein CheW [Cyanobacteria bacterium P01_H01_bin.26]
MNSGHISETRKFITFQISSYWYVIPMAAVLKIVNCPPKHEGGLVGFGVVQIGPHTIQLLNLHRIFEPDANTQLPEEAPFLVVLQSQENKLWGITLDAPPDLIDLPLAALKPVSLDEHFKLQSPWISHVGVIDSQAGKRTLLRLDMKAIFQQNVEHLTVSSAS